RSSEGATRAAAKAAAPSVVQSYTGCLNPTVNLIYDVAPGETPAHPPCKLGSSDIHLSSGDLTSLTAGTGLTGGGDNGAVTVGIAPSYRLPQGCAAGQTAGSNGTGGWACAADNVGPSYSAGLGLTLLGTTFSVDTASIQR